MSIDEKVRSGWCIAHRDYIFDNVMNVVFTDSCIVYAVPQKDFDVFLE